MHNGLRLLYPVVLAALVMFSATGARAGGGGGGGGGTGPTGDNPPDPPSFSGTTALSTPCEFNIQLTAADADGDLSHFTMVSGTLPGTYQLNDDRIQGHKICDAGTWKSEWKAVDAEGNMSTASPLEIQCSTSTNTSPSAPTYSGQLGQTTPCSFNVSISSYDRDGDDIVLTLDSGCLPSGHTFNGNTIVGGQTSEIRSWTCTVTASDRGCNPPSTSSVTMTCDAPAQQATGSCTSDNFESCCMSNPSESICQSYCLTDQARTAWYSWCSSNDKRQKGRR